MTLSPGRAQSPPEPKRSLAVLALLRNRLRSFSVWGGALAAGWFIVIALASSFVVDWSLVLPVPVRLVALVAGIGFLTHVLGSRILGPLSRRMPDTDLAKLMEASHPELRQSIISAIELSREGSEAALHVSPSMIASVIREAEADAERVDHRRVVDSAPLRRRSVFLGAAVLLLLALALQ